MRSGTIKRVARCTRVNGLIKSSFYKFLWVSYVLYDFYSLSMHNQLLLNERKKPNPKHLFGLIRMGKNVKHKYIHLEWSDLKTKKKCEINGRVSEKRGMHKQHSPISLVFFLCVCMRVMLICLEHDLAITGFVARV